MNNEYKLFKVDYKAINEKLGYCSLEVNYKLISAKNANEAVLKFMMSRFGKVINCLEIV